MIGCRQMSDKPLDDNVVPLQKKDEENKPKPPTAWEDEAKKRKEKQELDRKRNNAAVIRSYRLKKT